MQSKAGTLIKGIGIGMISGAAVTFTVQALTSNKNNLAKGSTKLVNAMGEMVDGIQTMFK